MTRRSRGIGIVVALASLAGVSIGQGSRFFARYDKPLRSATLDLGTGTVTRGPTIGDRTAGTVVDFHNNDLSGFVGVDTGTGFCEWFDAGVKGSLRGDGTADIDSGNISDLMNSIVFAYCSAALGVASGGPGGSVRLGFYEGYVVGGNVPTTTIAAFTLTALPANSASSSFFGGFACRFIRIVFGNLVCFSDGPIGYSWRFLDNGTGTLNPVGATLAATWPFLSCTRSCSNTLAGIDGQGMTDVIDQYCPPGFLRATFTFGTTSGTYTSMSMDIEEVADQVGTVTTFNSSVFPNRDTLISSVANVGATYTAAVTLGLERVKGAGSWTLYFGTQKANPPTGILYSNPNFGLPATGRMLLCWLDPSGFSCTGSHTGVSGTTSPNACNGVIPKKLSLVCNNWCGQAIVLGQVGGADGGGVARFTSAVSGVVGNL